MRTGDFVVSDALRPVQPSRIQGFLWEFLAGPYCSVKTPYGMAYIKSSELTVVRRLNVGTDAGQTLAKEIAAHA